MHNALFLVSRRLDGAKIAVFKVIFPDLLQPLQFFVTQIVRNLERFINTYFIAKDAIKYLFINHSRFKLQFQMSLGENLLSQGIVCFINLSIIHHIYLKINVAGVTNPHFALTPREENRQKIDPIHVSSLAARIKKCGSNSFLSL